MTCDTCTREVQQHTGLVAENGEPLVTTVQAPVDMQHYFAEEHELGWETAHPPVMCPQCGKQDVLTIDANDNAEVRRIGMIMADLCQAKRDGEHAAHAAGKHDGTHRWCHFCCDARPAEEAAI